MLLIIFMEIFIQDFFYNVMINVLKVTFDQFVASFLI